MDLCALIWLLPIVFMLHDFEEAVMFIPWYKKNREFLLYKFPKFAPKIAGHFDKLSSSSYIFIIAGEFFVFSLVSFISVIYNMPYLWFGALIAFGIHLVAHIIQFLIIRRYIPVIITSVPALAYCVYSAVFFINADEFRLFSGIIWVAVITAVLALNFVIWQKAAIKFERFLKRF